MEVAITYMRIVRMEEGKGSVSTTIVHGLVGPKEKYIYCNQQCWLRKGRGLTLLHTWLIGNLILNGRPRVQLLLGLSFPLKTAFVTGEMLHQEGEKCYV